MKSPARNTMTPKIQSAITLSSRLHRHQTRKGDASQPYASHPFSVAWMLQGYTSDEDVIVAALLHDVLEDCPGYSFENLLADFGPAVAVIVKEVSEDKDPGGESDGRLTWDIRKNGYLRRLEHDSEQALLICAADKIHNMQSITALYGNLGDALWEAFNAPPEKKLWYYEQVLKVLKRRLNSGIVAEYEKSIREFKMLLQPGEAASANH